MLTKEEYLRDPCRAASIPYWKAVRIAAPENMKILHEDDFRAEMLRQYVDEPYFRLVHDLQVLEPVAVPEGYSLCRGTAEEFAVHIRQCYGNGMTVTEVSSYAEREVYCRSLWLALRERGTGKIVATGIGELDRDMGEGILEWIQVTAEYRGLGLGSYIVRELLWRMKEKAKFVTVSGQCGNPTNPEGLYRKCGFTGHDVWHVLRKRMGGSMEIKFENIILRDMIESDIEDYVRWFTVEREWENWDAPWEKEDTDEESERRSWTEYYESVKQIPDDALRWKFEIEWNGRHIGWVSSYMTNENYEWIGADTIQPGQTVHRAIGICICGPDVWGNGIGTNALRAFVNYYFDRGVTELHTQTWSGNARMLRCAEKLGFEECNRYVGIRQVAGKSYDGLTFRLEKK